MDNNYTAELIFSAFVLITPVLVYFYQQWQLNRPVDNSHLRVSPRRQIQVYRPVETKFPDKCTCDKPAKCECEGSNRVDVQLTLIQNNYHNYGKPAVAKQLEFTSRKIEFEKAEVVEETLPILEKIINEVKTNV